MRRNSGDEIRDVATTVLPAIPQRVASSGGDRL